MTIQAKDYGSYLSAVLGIANKAVTAAGTGDAAYQAGAIHDMQTLDHPLSGLAVIPYTTTLADTKTLSVKVKLEHGDLSNLGDAADYTFKVTGGEVNKGVVATGTTGGSTSTGVITQRFDLSGLKRYFRLSVYVDLNATGTDTVSYGSALVLGGLEKI